MANPFDGVEEQLLREAKEALGQPEESFWDVVMGFVHAVDWQERWIQGILAAHAVTLLLVVLLRRSPTFLTLVFFAGAGIVFSAERLNALGSYYWQDFATQNYFDERGVFFGTLISGPLLLILFAVLVIYLLQLSDLMVRTKRKELAIKARQRAQQGTGSQQGGGHQASAEAKKGQ